MHLQELKQKLICTWKHRKEKTQVQRENFLQQQRTLINSALSVILERRERQINRKHQVRGVEKAKLEKNKKIFNFIV